METKDPKDSEVSNANNTDRVYWNEGNREVHQYSKAKLKVLQSFNKDGGGSRQQDR
jgi:hypothetical protein